MKAAKPARRKAAKKQGVKRRAVTKKMSSKDKEIASLLKSKIPTRKRKPKVRPVLPIPEGKLLFSPSWRLDPEVMAHRAREARAELFEQNLIPKPIKPKKVGIKLGKKKPRTKHREKSPDIVVPRMYLTDMKGVCREVIEGKPCAPALAEQRISKWNEVLNLRG